MAKSLFNKLLSKVIPSLTDEGSEFSSEEVEQKEICKPDPNDLMDVTFAKNLTSRGGKFFYCEDDEDFFHLFKQLLHENNWNKPYCSNDRLKETIKPIGANLEPDFTKAAASISFCEFLIAFDASVMVSSKQFKSVKVEQLPEAHIIVAYTSQIVKNISEAMSSVHAKYAKEKPVLTTTIRTKQSVTNTNSGRAKDLYIFLIEDYKEN